MLMRSNNSNQPYGAGNRDFGLSKLDYATAELFIYNLLSKPQFGEVPDFLSMEVMERVIETLPNGSVTGLDVKVTELYQSYYSTVEHYWEGDVYESGGYYESIEPTQEGYDEAEAKLNWLSELLDVIAYEKQQRQAVKFSI